MDYKDGVLYSAKFDDIYFSRASAIKESSHVYVSLLDEIWDSKDRFVVAEAGFGIGLNFLNLAKKFKKSSKILHYISIEKYPFNKKDFAYIWEKFGKFPNLSKKLISKYPNFKQGLRRIHFSKNIILDIYFGDIKEALKELDFKADVWFLDGFAPSKNPDMWDEETMKGFAKLSKFNSLLGSYCVARKVRDNLEKAGFLVEKKEGFASKREMTRAVFKGEDISKDEIWFSRPTPNLDSKTVLIVGAGIAGLSTAVKFKRAGFKVKIAEKNSKVALNGSGNLVGALTPLITQKGVLLGKMHMSAFLQAEEFYKKFAKKDAKFTGLKEFAFNENLQKRYKNSIFTLNDDEPYPSIFIKNASTIRVKKFCDKLAKNLDLLLGYEFVNFIKVKDGYEISFKNGKSINADIVIFCMGSHSQELFGRGETPRLKFDESVFISSVRGQATLIKKSIDTKFPLSARAYICPAIKEIQLIGATYDRGLYCDESRDGDDEINIKNIGEFLEDKSPEILGSKVGYRSYSGDRFPMIGPLYDASFYKQNYKSAHWGKQSFIAPKYIEGVYIDTAHGARGLGTAIMASELLLDYVLGRPLCVEKEIANAVHPARFLVRKLKKGLV
ncbi:MAG: bifunctional tRNA (5-methylaminomethyl-2-thiouridine)(34)-methyltransferase MnmD/FAD-dependent 5-carboxymethylaminomethyl-2-thiouridine(34) oxidoreductase MnmC [Campylobacter sp.]|nr:bifunctional tRNA (5-methylaminomethyl-2-thiouridine)(34)-methyltransferase MnmD/FAD-dependent 5-carboxymethylaminomethyl-2-thiouridine(34) oxidoreductase MnmC [Campylobacter sp.]